MTEKMCQAFAEAKARPLTRKGLALTDFSGTRATLFKKIENPQSYLVRLRHTADTYDNWRDGLPLDPEIQAYTLGWPVEVELDPGFPLDEASGIPAWEVERAVEGLEAGEPHYIELASGLLVDSQGCFMEMPGRVNAALIRADAFESRVTIRKPLLLLGAMNA
jgi:hypothetical protein